MNNSMNMSEERVVESEYFIYQSTSLQMEREVELSSRRLTWYLTFNGFLFTAFALIYHSGLDGVFEYLIVFVIAFSGFCVSVLTYFGLKASEKMRDRIRKFWNSIDKNKFPPFYSEKNTSLLGRKCRLEYQLLWDVRGYYFVSSYFFNFYIMNQLFKII